MGLREPALRLRRARVGVPCPRRPPRRRSSSGTGQEGGAGAGEDEDRVQAEEEDGEGRAPLHLQVHHLQQEAVINQERVKSNQDAFSCSLRQFVLLIE